MSDIFKDTNCICFELSNSCQLACLHQACPLSKEMASPFRIKQPVHLPAKVVYDALEALGRHNYSGEINFHQYNEPLIDPRLFEFIRAARRECPESKIIIITNGLNISEQLAIELKEAGCTGLWVTRYGGEEDRKATYAYVKSTIEPVFGKHWCNVLPWQELDRRITIYDRDYSDLSDACYAPICTVAITRNADVALCCYDWARTVTFGNLRETTLEDILGSGKMREVYQSLVAGNRGIHDVCRRCRFSVTPFK